MTSMNELRPLIISLRLRKPNTDTDQIGHHGILLSSKNYANENILLEFVVDESLKSSIDVSTGNDSKNSAAKE